MIAFILATAWASLWMTPDQQGRQHFERGEFSEAAASFEDPMWRATALYRAGEFEAAAQTYARRDTAEAHFNQGNAWLMHGAYSTAIGCYERALEKQPGWGEAEVNQALAEARAKLVEAEGGEMGDQLLGADKIVFDNKAKNEGQDTTLTDEQTVSQQDVQAMWLRRVQTRPADFLKAKFSFQAEMQDQGESE